MIFKVAVLLLAAWLLGVVGLYSAGQWHHLLLLSALMMLLLSFARARDAALRK